jgi:hypothetical protein
LGCASVDVSGRSKITPNELNGGGLSLRTCECYLDGLYKHAIYANRPIMVVQSDAVEEQDSAESPGDRARAEQQVAVLQVQAHRLVRAGLIRCNNDQSWVS